ncbi:hypothetical protein [Streptomyces sp. NPDC003327]
MLRFRPRRWAAVLLTAFALLVPALSGSVDTPATAAAVVADGPQDDMIWG